MESMQKFQVSGIQYIPVLEYTRLISFDKKIHFDHSKKIHFDHSKTSLSS